MIGEPPEMGTQGPSRKWNLDRQVHCSAADPSFAHFVTAGVEPIFFRTFHETQRNEPSLRRRLQRVRRCLRPLRGLMPAGNQRAHDGPMHCAGYGLRCVLPACRWLHGPQKRVRGAGLQALCGDLQGMRRRMRQTHHGSLPGMRQSLPSLRAGVRKDDGLMRSLGLTCRPQKFFCARFQPVTS